ncbi:hypothetical protein [Polaromonas sp. CG9_12]|nr:hypothetical protein [Polaromonas sp. CG9_12]
MIWLKMLRHQGSSGLHKTMIRRGAVRCCMRTLLQICVPKRNQPLWR